MSSGRIALMAALGLAPVFSQIPTGRVHDHNLHAWFVYAGDHALAGRWGVHLEGQWRRHDAGLRPQQLLLRPAVNYQLNPSVAFSTGYAYVTTHRYGEYPVLAPFPEHRIYQQATVQHKAKRLDLLHRFRLEQRWIGQRFPEGVSPPEIQPWRYPEPVSIYAPRCDSTRTEGLVLRVAERDLSELRTDARSAGLRPESRLCGRGPTAWQRHANRSGLLATDSVTAQRQGP